MRHRILGLLALGAILSCAAAEEGLRAQYFSNTTLTPPAVIDTVVPTVSFNWGSSGPAGVGVNQFSARWSGHIIPAESGPHTIFMRSDDGARVWLDGVLIINDWSAHSARDASAVVDLVAGAPVDLIVEYYEGAGSAVAQLSWATPTLVRHPIPPAQLRPTLVVDPIGSGTGLMGYYYAGRDFNRLVLSRLDSRVAFNWSGGAPAADVPADNFSVRWLGYYEAQRTEPLTLIARADDGVRVWLDGMLVINDWVPSSARDRTYTFDAEAGRRYAIRMDYFEAFHSASAALEFQGPNTPRASLSTQFYPIEGAQVSLPTASAVSPVFLEGTYAPGVTLTATAAGEVIPVETLSETTFYLNCPLSANTATPVVIQAGGFTHESTIAWTPTAVVGESDATIRAGDALLFQTVTDGFRRIDHESGVELPEAATEAGALWPFRFGRPGIYHVVTLDAEGEVTGKVDVTVVGVAMPESVASKVNYSRVFETEFRPLSATPVFVANDPAYVTVSPATPVDGIVAVTGKPLRRGSPEVVARLHANGPIIARTRIEEFTYSVASLRQAVVNAATGIGTSTLVMRPYVENVEFRLDMFAHKGRFKGGVKSFRINTSADQSTHGEPGFTTKVDEKTGETIGIFRFDLEIPSNESMYCYRIRAWQAKQVVSVDDAGTQNVLLGANNGTAGMTLLGIWNNLFAATSEGDSPASDSENVNGDLCQVEALKSLVFTEAMEEEDEVTDGAPEMWKSREWPLMTVEVCIEGEDGDGKCSKVEYLLKVGDGDQVVPVDNPRAALFAKSDQKSKCMPCDGKCGPVSPLMDSGTYPSRYETTIEVCSTGDGDALGSAQGGEFFIAKLDAHGLKAGTRDRFPERAPTLPRRAGTIVAPVIIMLEGGDKAFGGCSLYGSVCEKENTWSFQAKVDGHDPEDFVYIWDLGGGNLLEGDLGDLSARQSGSEQVKVEYPAGRFIPRLLVYERIPSGNGEGDDVELFEKAEIHRIAVDENRAKLAGGPEPLVDEDIRFGEAFHVTCHIGGGLSADARIGIEAPSIVLPTPEIGVRGRVSLDGYPQNEYWVGEDDAFDLPQVVTVGAGPYQFWLQGYGIGSEVLPEPPYLTVVLDGQAQLEVCESVCTRFMGDGNPVTVTWQSADRERFRTYIPAVIVADDPEAAADHVFEDGDWPVPADNVTTHPSGDRPFLSRVNIRSHVPWYGTHAAYQDLELKAFWKVEAQGGNFCSEPKMWPHLGGNETAGTAIADLEVWGAGILLNFGAEHPQDAGDIVAKAGDAFTVKVAIVLDPDPGYGPPGDVFADEVSIGVTPGAKVFHVPEPNVPDDPRIVGKTPVDAAGAFTLSREQFRTRYKDFEWFVPIDPGHREDIVLYCFDRFRNPVGAGRIATFSMDGGGYLGSFDPEANDPIANRAGELEAEADDSGRVSVAFRQENYAHCPWNDIEYPIPAVVVVAMDGTAASANHAVVEADLAASPQSPKLELTFGSFGGPSTLRLDDPRYERAETSDSVWEARVSWVFTNGDRIPARDSVVYFASTNGAVKPAPGFSASEDGGLRTDNEGRCRIALTRIGARLTDEFTGPVLLTARTTNEQLAASGETSWYSEAQTQISLEHEVLAADRTQDGFVEVETLRDDWESSVPALAALGGAVGDGKLRIPVHAKTKVRVKSLPNHRLWVSLGGSPLALGSSALRYPFDEIVNGHTPETAFGHVATVEEGVMVDTEQRREGEGSLVLQRSGTVIIPDHPLLSAADGLQVAMWFQSERRQRGMLIERPGQYSLELLRSGHLQWTVRSRDTRGRQRTTRLRSELTVSPGEWTYVIAAVQDGALTLRLGPSAEAMDVTFAVLDGRIPIAEPGPMTVGERFVGWIDDLRISDPPRADGLLLQGVGAGQTIVTDANGLAEFVICSDGSWNRNEYRPQEQWVVVGGSQQAQARFYRASSTMDAHLKAIGAARYAMERPSMPPTSWWSRVTDWATDHLPLVGSLKQLYRESYKAATGCDRVDKLNLTFAVVGLIADIATFGTAGAAVRGGQTLIRTVWKTTLKLFATNVVAGVAIQAGTAAAINGYIRLAGSRIAEADENGGATEPWVQGGKGFLDQVVADVEGGGDRSTWRQASLGSVDACFDGAAIHAEVGADFSQALEDLAAEAADAGLAHHMMGDPVRMAVVPAGLGAIGQILAMEQSVVPAEAAAGGRVAAARRLASLMQGALRKSRGAQADKVRSAIQAALRDPSARRGMAHLMRVLDAGNVSQLRQRSTYFVAALRRNAVSQDDIVTLFRNIDDVARQIPGMAGDSRRGFEQLLSRLAPVLDQANFRVAQGMAKGAIGELTALRSGKVRNVRQIQPNVSRNSEVSRDFIADVSGVSALGRRFSFQDTFVEVKNWKPDTFTRAKNRLSDQMTNHFRNVQFPNFQKLVVIVPDGTPNLRNIEKSIKKAAIKAIPVEVAGNPAQLREAIRSIVRNIAVTTERLP